MYWNLIRDVEVWLFLLGDYHDFLRSFLKEMNWVFTSICLKLINDDASRYYETFPRKRMLLKSEFLTFLDDSKWLMTQIFKFLLIFYDTILLLPPHILNTIRQIRINRLRQKQRPNKTQHINNYFYNPIKQRILNY